MCVSGSGKTFTMEGHEDGDDSQRGMIARAVEQVFACSSQLVDKGWSVSGEGEEEGGVVYSTRHHTNTQIHTHIHTHTHIVEETLKHGHDPPRQNQSTLSACINPSVPSARGEVGSWSTGWPASGKPSIHPRLRPSLGGVPGWSQLAHRGTEGQHERPTDNLIVRLDEKGQQSSSSHIGTLKAVCDLLQKVFSEQNPHSILIRDDIWTSNVTQHFVIPCHTIRQKGVHL